MKSLQKAGEPICAPRICMPLISLYGLPSLVEKAEMASCRDVPLSCLSTTLSLVVVVMVLVFSVFKVALRPGLI